MLRFPQTATLSLLVLITSGCRWGGLNNSDLSAKRLGGLFDDNKILVAELRAPLKAMFDAKDDRETHDVDLNSGEADPPWFSNDVTFKVDTSEMKAKVRVRGGVRRGCSFPPIKLKLSKDDARNTPFSGFKAFKLGTHCEPEEDHRLAPYHEHALYRMYAVLSKVHFRSRLLNIRYLDVSSGLDVTEPGLLLEDPEDVGEHAGGLQELRLTSLEQATPPSNSDPDDIKQERRENQRFAMLQTLRVEAIAKERQKRHANSPEMTPELVEDSLRHDRDQIWREAGLPGLTDSIADLELFFKKMDDALAPRQRQIARRQEELKGALNRITIARILAFQLLALNTDWNVFGSRKFLGSMGVSDDQVKNAKVLMDHSGRIFAVPYDFDLASVFGRSGDLRGQYEARLKKVMTDLGETTLPSRREFVTVLQEIVAAEKELVDAASDAHLGSDDQERLLTAVRTFIDLARTLR